MVTLFSRLRKCLYTLQKTIRNRVSNGNKQDPPPVTTFRRWKKLHQLRTRRRLLRKWKEWRMEG
jgi:hypothetical protein